MVDEVFDGTQVAPGGGVQAGAERECDGEAGMYAVGFWAWTCVAANTTTQAIKLGVLIFQSLTKV